MFHEYRDIIVELKVQNSRFHNLFNKHNELDDKIASIESGKEHVTEFDLDTLKKEKLKLKDEVYNIIMEYKKENNL